MSGLCLFGLVGAGCGGSGGSSGPTVGIYDATVVEGARDLEFVVGLSSASTRTVSVDYATADGTAVAERDYLATTGTVRFAPGEIRRFVTVAVLDNASAPDGTSRNMRLVLSNSQHARLSTGTGTGTIIDRHATLSQTAFDAGWGQAGAFTSAARCADCHRSQDPIMVFDGRDISPGTQWRHSVMANSATDPYWRAAVQDESDSFPSLSGFIEDKCATCHAPMGRTHAHHTGADLDSDGYYRMTGVTTENHAREGVSCTACHQIEAGNLGTPGSFSGGYTIPGDPSDPDYKRVYGPYGSPLGNIMFTQTGHRPTEGAYVSESELCASCHTLYTPALDPDTGAASGVKFLEQGPYLEWQNSVYATGQAREAQCQDCHMPEPDAGYSTPISTLPMMAPSRTPYGQHTLVGGNAHLLEILRDYRVELGISGSTSAAGFDEQISLTRDFLAGAASIAVSTLSASGGDLNFDITVTNNTGHKIPTAYPSRRVWLHVTVEDANGNIIFESGKPDSRGYISTDDARLKADCISAHKLDGFDSSLCYEPHRDVIDNPSQVAIYESVLGDVNDNITHTLLQGARYLKDNRIPPDGFSIDKASTIEAQTIPVGVGRDGDFNCVNTAEGCGADTVHYQVDIGGRAGPYSVQVRLLYQATQPAFVDGMHSVGDRVNRFKVMYDVVRPSVEVLATASG